MNMRVLKPADVVIICLVAAVTLFSAGFWKRQADALFVEAEAPSKENQEERYRAVYPLAGDREFTVEGAEGTVRVAVKDGEVSVVSAPCRNKICQLSRPIKKPGEWIACIPGKVIIRIRGQAETGFGQTDAVSY